MTTLIDYVKNSTGFAESTIAAVTNSTIAFLSANLRNGEEAKLEGLGTFKVTDKPERPGRNPRTGETITLKASRKTKLTFAKSFLASIQPDPNAVVPATVESTIPIAVIPPIPADLMPPPMVIPPIPADLLPSMIPELLWQIKAPDDSFIQAATSELSGWGVTATTPVYSPATGWKLAGKVPELAGIIAQS